MPLYMWVLGALLPPPGSSPAPEATVCHSAQEPACLWLQIPALLLPSCITSGKSLNLSEPQFSNLQNGVDNRNCLIGGQEDLMRRCIFTSVPGTRQCPVSGSQGCYF